MEIVYIEFSTLCILAAVIYLIDTDLISFFCLLQENMIDNLLLYRLGFGFIMLRKK